ncbi:hypothetical protein FRC16_007377, partial [Serendipita sp. 398]
MTTTPVPFSGSLDIVSFTASITTAIAISASITFATGGSFMGVQLDASQEDAEVQRTLQQVSDSSTLFAWSMSLSALSLMVSLVIRLLLTDDLISEAIRRDGRNLLKTSVGIGSWVAIGVQGTALAVIGEAMKVIDEGSGKLIQVWAPLSVIEMNWL